LSYWVYSIFNFQGTFPSINFPKIKP